MKNSLKLYFSVCFLLFAIFINGQSYEIRVGNDVNTSCHTVNQASVTTGLISIKVNNLSGSPVFLKIGSQTEAIEIPAKGKEIKYDYQGIPPSIDVKFFGKLEYESINNICQSPERKSSNTTQPSKTSDFIFTPSPEEEKTILAALTNSKSAKENKNDIYLLYDVKNNDFSYREGSKTIFKMRPKIDQNIYIKINNYKPYQDSILVKYNFYDRNLEYGDRIINFLNGQTNLTKEAEEKTDTTKTAENGANATSKQAISPQVIQSFKEEMMRFYLNKKDEITNDKVNVLEEYIYLIQRKIKEKFVIESAVPEEILKLVNKKIDSDTALSSDRKEDLEATLRTGVDYYRRILEYNVLSYPPIQVKNFDVTELKFEIYRNQKLINNQDNNYSYLNKGGFKIDFSLGFMGHWLSNRTYTTTSVQQMDTVYRVVDSVRTNEVEKVNVLMKDKIIRDDEGDFSINIGVLSHFYFRTGRRINGSLSTGISLGENSKVRYLAGGSVLLGSEQRLIITGGCALGQVKRLKSIFTEGQLLEVTTTPPALDKEVWKGAWFVSFSFNFGSVSTGGKK